VNQAASFELSGVCFSHGREQVLRDLSLSIRSGEQVALIGPSGAGKTTLLRLLCGGLLPQQGSLMIDGQCFVRAAQKGEPSLRQLRARVGFIHQDHALVPNLRVIQNIVAGRFGKQGFWAALRALIRPQIKDQQQILDLLERVGISEKMYHRVDTLSGGQQQRAAIARALFQDPEAILADEPVASVDPARARAILELLVGVSRERGLTLVVSLHDPDLAFELFPRVIGLRGGQMVFDQAGSSVQNSQLESLYRLP
jgi:phosphonate transport system ATP-binding protein